MLKDITKVLVGVFISDMIANIWFIGADMLPINLFGVQYGFTVAMIIILTDFAVLILLIYYSWFWKKKVKKDVKEEVVEQQE